MNGRRLPAKSRTNTLIQIPALITEASGITEKASSIARHLVGLFDKLRRSSR